MVIILGNNDNQNGVRELINKHDKDIEVKTINDIDMDFIDDMLKHTNGYDDFLTPGGKSITEEFWLDAPLSKYKEFLLSVDEIIKTPIIVNGNKYCFGCEKMKEILGV